MDQCLHNDLSRHEANPEDQISFGRQLGEVLLFWEDLEISAVLDDRPDFVMI